MWFFVLLMALSGPGEVKGPFPTLAQCEAARTEVVTYTEPVPQVTGPGEASACYRALAQQ